jgi:hypothetical protein
LSRLWNRIKEFELTQNMRLAAALSGPTTGANEKFAQTLLQLGEGKRQKNDFAVVKLLGIICEACADKRTMNERIAEFVYHNLSIEMSKSDEAAVEYLIARCILAPLNRDMKQLNDQIMSSLPGEAITLQSIDTPDPDGCDSLPEECLNALSILGLPEHLISLKPGMPVVVTRNMNINGGICKGT